MIELITNNPIATIFVITTITLFVLESIRPWYQDKNESRYVRMSRNFFLTITNALILGAVLSWIGIELSRVAAENPLGFFHVEQWPTWIEFILMILILDFALYAWHVTLHKVRLFWQVHIVHHTDLVLDFSTGFRFHAFEMLGTVAVHFFFYYMLGATLEVMALNQTLLIIFTEIGHSNSQNPRWIDRTIGKIFVTPRFHHVHHSLKQKEHDSNYGTVFSFWDKIFLTYTNPDTVKDLTIGDSNYPKPVNLFRLFILPFKRYVRSK